MSRQLLNEFQNDYKNNQKNFVEKQVNGVRILTFNVHMWKDYNNKNKYSEILDVIEESGADIVGLQEALLFDKNISLKFKKDFEKLGYTYQVVCNEKHGINMLFSKREILSTQIIKLKVDPIRKQSRYAILANIKLSNSKTINLVVTHLDVYDESEQTRLDQIKQILDTIPTNSIIMGDLNSLRFKDYNEDEWNKIVMHDRKRGVESKTLLTEYLESNGFIEGAEFCNKITNMTVWAMRRVDYIYVHKTFEHTIIGYNTYPTLTSDHYPVYVDLEF
jgi:endonuclease/exonuclease/phosphatase family metal-dependent hydrolase